jgi:site-specific DNA-methyltransferase (adenine-specific)
MKFEDIIKGINVKPYYQDESTVIYCADCREILPMIPDKSVDLVLTDPPYGINVIGGSKSFGSIGGSNIVRVNRYAPVFGDNETPDLTECFRLSSNQIIFGGNYLDLPIRKGWIVWDKKCRNDWDDNFSDAELAWTSFDRVLKVYRCLYMGLLHPHQSEKRCHPTQKPLELMSWILHNYSIADDSILDPFLGSGTTCIASKQLGRKSIGIEISERYCEIAAKRLSQTVMQLEIEREPIKQGELISK